MTTFTGILNNNGTETKIRMFIELDKHTSYVSDLYMNNVRYDIIVDGNTCSLITSKYSYLLDHDFVDKTNYELFVKKYQDEIIIVGREKGNIFECCLSYIFTPKFFVVSNKEEV